MVEVMQIHRDGPIFQLEEPHTTASIKAALTAYDGPHGLCRIRHRWKVIGAPYVPENDLWTAVFSLMASTDYGRLIRCSRCGLVRVERR